MGGTDRADPTPGDELLHGETIPVAPGASKPPPETMDGEGRSGAVPEDGPMGTVELCPITYAPAL